MTYKGATIYGFQPTNNMVLEFYLAAPRGRNFVYAYWPVMHEDKRIGVCCYSYGYHEDGRAAALVWIQP